MSFLLRFDPFLGSLWILSHIGKRCVPLMPYKSLEQTWVYHYYVVEACLALRCWQQNCVGIMRCRTWPSQSHPCPKANNTWDGHYPSKAPFYVGDFSHKLFVRFGSQTRTVLFSSDMSFLLRFDPFLGSLWILSHIDKKCTLRMPYKLLGKGMVYHYYTQNPKASQKWVEPVEETHIAWEQNHAGLAPQSGQIACAGNPPHKNALFEGSAHLKYCPLWRFSPQAKGLPCSRYWLDPRTVLLPTPECKARLYHYWW